MSQPTEQPRDVDWKVGQEGIADPHIVRAASWVRGVHFIEFSTAGGVVVLTLQPQSVQYIRRIG